MARSRIPGANNLRNQTIPSGFRLLRPMPQFDGTNIGDRGTTGCRLGVPRAANEVGEALLVREPALLAHYTWSKMIDSTPRLRATMAGSAATPRCGTSITSRLERAFVFPRHLSPRCVDGRVGTTVRQGRKFGST